MSSGYKTGIAFVVIMFFVSGWLGYLDGRDRGRAQGRAEQEAFDHANAPAPIFNEVPSTNVCAQVLPNFNGGDTSKTDVQREKPHKAAPKPGGVDLHPCIGTATEANCYNSANAPTSKKPKHMDLTVPLESSDGTWHCPKGYDVKVNHEPAPCNAEGLCEGVDIESAECVPASEKQSAPPLTGHAYLWHDTDGKYKILHSDGDVQVCPFTELSDCMNWVATADWTTIY